jgi:hypothetical protein
MDWMIYGANGYTGELIARDAKKRGANPVLAGRDATKIAKLATHLSLPSKVFSLDKPPNIFGIPPPTGPTTGVADQLLCGRSERLVCSYYLHIYFLRPCRRNACRPCMEHQHGARIDHRSQ